jgi:glycosyltransferase involved in cell wall biosynthesis
VAREIEKIISIITPNYNSVKHIKQCYESVKQQQFRDFEWIIVDDNSSDESVNIIRDLIMEDVRMILITSKERLGPARARNIGIKNANGSLIFFLDSDDYIKDTCLSDLYQSYCQNNVDIIIGDFLIIDGDFSYPSKNSLFFEKDKLLEGKILIEYILTYLSKPNRLPLFTTCWGKLFRKSIIDDFKISFDENLKTFEDLDFIFRFMIYADKIIFLNRAIYFHTIHRGYSSRTSYDTMNLDQDLKNLFGYFKALEIVRQYLEINSVEKKVCDKHVGLATVNFTIIQLIRMMGQLKLRNFLTFYSNVNKILQNKILRKYIKYYTHSKGESKYAKFFLKYKLTLILMLIFKRKSLKRYL